MLAASTMKRCTYCGTDNDEAAKACSQCGSDFHTSYGRFTARGFYLDPVSRFRVIVVTGLICYLLYAVGPWVFWPNLSREAGDVLSWRGLEAILPLPPVVYWLTLALWAAAAVGLYFFIRAARALFTGLIGLSIVITLLGGMHVGLASESFVLYLANLSDGAVLVLAYWSPLRKKFMDTPKESSGEASAGA